jgi:hypothetical protein
MAAAATAKSNTPCIAVKTLIVTAIQNLVIWKIRFNGVARMIELSYNTGVNHIKSDGLLAQHRHPFSTYVRGIDTMSYSIPNPTEQSNIPYGYCRCGCGQLAPIAKVTRHKAGHVKGEPIRFISGHRNTKRYFLADPNPSGLCMCGCGQLTNIAKLTDVRSGSVAGKHTRFLPGHFRTIPLAVRFWEKVNKDGPIHPALGTACWLWQAHDNGRGYGVIMLEGKPHRSEYAHRISYEMENGPLERGDVVCHKCDNPSCVNPAHLFVGTHKDNTADKIAKDRHARGSRSGHAKLSDDDVLEIFTLLGRGVEQKEIGQRFGITQSAVSNIRRGVTWKHFRHSREQLEVSP